MWLYRTKLGPICRVDGENFLLDVPWNRLFNQKNLVQFLEEVTEISTSRSDLEDIILKPLAPIESQEVWAAGVTYFRSRTARMKEAEEAGGGNFYDRVYAAPRPELFLKATPHRVVGSGQSMRLRSDSKWIVPEPELVLAINCDGEIFGYTVGNDLSCRDIEGENPLYLPQAKTFDRCAAVGPAIWVSETPPAKESIVRLAVRRGNTIAVEGSTTLMQIKRSYEELVSYLFHDNSFPEGCLLMTGTGIVPAGDFSLQSGDVVEIEIDCLGTLINTME